MLKVLNILFVPSIILLVKLIETSDLSKSIKGQKVKNWETDNINNRMKHKGLEGDHGCLQNVGSIYLPYLSLPCIFSVLF